MRSPSRATLLICTVIVVGIITYFGNGLELMLEPEQYSISKPVFWLTVGIVLALPLWAPAVFPSRYPTGLKICSWISIVLLLYPSWHFVKGVIDITSRKLSGVETFPLFLMPLLAVNFCCFISFITLLVPKLRSRLQST
ncbi:hypothetical protein ACUTAF_14375 [Pseudomonas sp. SP16.1]|uniref:hypothetical protein n=1 Tax=Pseudomonas sp. SP16.1 TaxID=3458854 RepID=UPI0040459935